MPFSNTIVQAIEAGCLHLAETLTGMGQPADTVIIALLARYPFLSQADATVIEDIAIAGRGFPGIIDQLPPGAIIPTDQIPVNPVVTPGTIEVGVEVDLEDEDTGEVKSPFGTLIIPNQSTIDQLNIIIDQWIDSVIDKYTAERLKRIGTPRIIYGYRG